MKPIDLGNDKEYKIVLRLAIPAMLAQFVNVLYSIVDRLYISNMGTNGDLALAGIGVVAPICTLITSFSFLIGLGGAPLMAISLGEKNENKAKSILANSFLALIILGIIVPTIILSCYRPLLMTFGSTENTFSFAKDYLLIYLIGAPFTLITLGLNQFIISLGYSTKGMVTMVIGAVINIILDPIFIFNLGMGIKGAALATIIAQFCSFIYAVIVLSSKKAQVRISFGNYNYKIMLKIMTLGLSPFIIAASDSIVCIVLNMSIKLQAGNLVDEYINVATITNSFFQIFTMPLLGISGGTGAILSYNYGARNINRVKKGEKYILLLALCFTTIAFILGLLIPHYFINLFKQSEIVNAMSLKMIRIFMTGIILLSFQYCFVDGLTALGRAKEAVTLSLIRKISVIALTLLLPLVMGIDGCFYAELISDVVASTITLIAFCFIFKKILEKRVKDSAITISS